MHAASVNPEPGSNSLKNYISTPSGVNTFFRASLTLKYFYFAWFVFSSGIFEISHTILSIVLCVSSLVLLFNFQWPTPCSAAQLFYYTAPYPVCQYLFETFLKFLRPGSRLRSYQRPLLRSFVSIPPRITLVNTFFESFFEIFSLFFGNSIYFIFWTCYNNMRHIFCAFSTHFKNRSKELYNKWRKHPVPVPSASAR